MSDFVDRADLVALVQLGPSVAEPSWQLEDEVTVRLVATGTVVDPVKGAAVGDKVKIVHSTRSTNPQRPDQVPDLFGPTGHEVKEGDRLIVALAAPDESGERAILTLDSFFVDLDGRLDPALAATRIACATEARPLFTETANMTTKELLAALTAQV